MVLPPEPVRAFAHVADVNLRDIIVRTLLALGRCIPRVSDDFVATEEWLRAEPVDLFIIDATPDVDGACAQVAALRRTIAADNPFAVVIMVTAQSDAKHVGRLKACGADTVLIKPIDPVMLAVKVTSLTRQRRAFVASPGYIGPERRTGASRPGTKPAPRIPVPNPLREMYMATMSRDEMRERIRLAWVALDEQWVDHEAA